MVRRAFALALLAAPGLAQDEPDEEKFENFALEGRILRGERHAPAVFVRLEDEGVLRLKVGDAWRDVTLDRLGELLAKARDDDHAAQVAIGKSGLVDLEGGGKATRLFVSLDAGPTVPWQHVQWVVTVLMEQKYTNLELVEGKRSLLVVLPADRTGCGLREDRPPVATASVLVVARGPQPARWGDAEIQRPTEVRIRFGDADTDDLAAVTAYLREKKRAAEEDGLSTRFYGRVKVGIEVPLGGAFDVFETFVAAKVPHVNTAETFVAIPPRALRHAKRLPYPKAPRREPTKQLPQPKDPDTAD